MWHRMGARRLEFSVTVVVLDVLEDTASVGTFPCRTQPFEFVRSGVAVRFYLRLSTIVCSTLIFVALIGTSPVNRLQAPYMKVTHEWRPPLSVIEATNASVAATSITFAAFTETAELVKD